MGRVHLKYNYGPLLGLCDVDQKHLNQAMDLARQNGDTSVQGYRDFREMLLRDDIDVVEVVTPPHWHAAMSIAVAESGKDVWCEKPMTRTIGEGKKVKEAIRRTGRMFRVNTWFRLENDWYGAGSPVAPIKKLADSGLLGWPLKMTLGHSTGFDWKFDRWQGVPGLKAEAVPAELDYDLWLGPAPYKPYNKERVHMNFRGYWDYDGGGLGDMGQHYLDPAQYILRKDDTSPIEIYADCEQQHPEAVFTFNTITLKYADGCELVLDGTPKRSGVALLEGPKGKLYPGFESDIPDLRNKLSEFPDPEPQVTDFAESVRTRQPFALNEQNGHRSATLINLAKIAMRTQRPLRYDPEKEVFINDDQANALIDEPARSPWLI
jgi:myo-inositol 2-dehydrogenase/D-chiro-inositol 1-dehydrogenase